MTLDRSDLLLAIKSVGDAQKAIYRYAILLRGIGDDYLAQKMERLQDHMNEAEESLWSILDQVKQGGI